MNRLKHSLTLGIAALVGTFAISCSTDTDHGPQPDDLRVRGVLVTSLSDTVVTVGSDSVSGELASFTGFPGEQLFIRFLVDSSYLNELPPGYSARIILADNAPEFIPSAPNKWDAFRMRGKIAGIVSVKIALVRDGRVLYQSPSIKTTTIEHNYLGGKRLLGFDLKNLFFETPDVRVRDTSVTGKLLTNEQSLSAEMQIRLFDLDLFPLSGIPEDGRVTWILDDPTLAEFRSDLFDRRLFRLYGAAKGFTKARLRLEHVHPFGATHDEYVSVPFPIEVY